MSLLQLRPRVTGWCGCVWGTRWRVGASKGSVNWCVCLSYFVCLISPPGKNLEKMSHFQLRPSVTGAMGMSRESNVTRRKCAGKVLVRVY